METAGGFKRAALAWAEGRDKLAGRGASFMSSRSALSDVAPRLSIPAFFDWIDRRERRYELVGGRPVLQPWVRRAHSLIAGNVAFALQSALDRDHFNVHQGDFAIETGPDSVRYADVLVEAAEGPPGGRIAERPLLIVEVLSDSTTDVDFGPKRTEYLQLPSLAAYLVLSQDHRHAWLWVRNGNSAWPDLPARLSDGVIRIDALKLELSFDEVYRGITFAA